MKASRVSKPRWVIAAWRVFASQPGDQVSHVVSPHCGHEPTSDAPGHSCFSISVTYPTPLDNLPNLPHSTALLTTLGLNSSRSDRPLRIRVCRRDFCQLSIPRLRWLRFARDDGRAPFRVLPTFRTSVQLRGGCLNHNGEASRSGSGAYFLPQNGTSGRCPMSTCPRVRGHQS